MQAPLQQLFFVPTNEHIYSLVTEIEKQNSNDRRKYLLM